MLKDTPIFRWHPKFGIITDDDFIDKRYSYKDIYEWSKVSAGTEGLSLKYDLIEDLRKLLPYFKKE